MGDSQDLRAVAPRSLVDRSGEEPITTQHSQYLVYSGIGMWSSVPNSLLGTCLHKINGIIAMRESQIGLDSLIITVHVEMCWFVCQDVVCTLQAHNRGPLHVDQGEYPDVVWVAG